MYRSPGAVLIWWAWVLFALANLVDLAVQGRDHTALDAAFSLLLLTSAAYVTAQRPRVIAAPGGLIIVNPVTEHRVGWIAVAAAEPGDLLRVRCEWRQGEVTRQRVIYAWAVHASRRRQLAAELRAQRRARRGAGAGWSGGFPGAGLSGGGAGGGLNLGGGFGRYAPPGPGASPADEPDPLRLDAARVLAAITERAGQARQAAPDDLAAAPDSSWNWTAVALVVVPALALLAVVLA